MNFAVKMAGLLAAAALVAGCAHSGPPKPRRDLKLVERRNPPGRPSTFFYEPANAPVGGDQQVVGHIRQ